MTDTNQASEEDLKQYLHEMHLRIMGDYSSDPWTEHPYQDGSKPYFWEDEAKNLSELIRTEKLKLLAEVRERVVGEDVEYVKWYTDITGEQDYYYTVKRPMSVKHQNELRGKQRTALNKLEAEL